VLVISGGYGVVVATESIGWYDRALHLGDWGQNLLERCIETYAKKHQLHSAVAFLARTGNYAKVVCRWLFAGVDRAYLVSPNTVEQRISQRLVARGYGEALAAFLQGRLLAGWSSEGGARVCIAPLK
jgi:hypothetical protein